MCYICASIPLHSLLKALLLLQLHTQRSMGIPSHHCCGIFSLFAFMGSILLGFVICHHVPILHLLTLFQLTRGSQSNITNNAIFLERDSFGGWGWEFEKLLFSNYHLRCLIRYSELELQVFQFQQTGAQSGSIGLLDLVTTTRDVIKLDHLELIRVRYLPLSSLYLARSTVCICSTVSYEWMYILVLV